MFFKKIFLTVSIGLLSFEVSATTRWFTFTGQVDDVNSTGLYEVPAGVHLGQTITGSLTLPDAWDPLLPFVGVQDINGPREETLYAPSSPVGLYSSLLSAEIETSGSPTDTTTWSTMLIPIDNYDRGPIYPNGLGDITIIYGQIAFLLFFWGVIDNSKKTAVKK